MNAAVEPTFVSAAEKVLPGSQGPPSNPSPGVPDMVSRSPQP
jgi:hypothetical protein